MKHDQKSPIHARSAFQKCSHTELEAMSAVALDAQRMVRAAAHPLEPGDTVKAQMRRASQNLRYVAGDWRVKAAWYGEAGCWGAALFRDFEERFHAWDARRQRRADAQQSTAEAALVGLRSALAAHPDEDFFRSAIESIDGALGDQGGKQTAMGERFGPPEGEG